MMDEKRNEGREGVRSWRLGGELSESEAVLIKCEGVERREREGPAARGREMERSARLRRG